MTTPPKTMAEICDEAATDWCIEKGVYNKEHFAFQAGFDCRDRLDNEALKIAVEALEKIKVLTSYAGTPTKEISEYLIKQAGIKSPEIANNALAEIRKLRGEG